MARHGYECSTLWWNLRRLYFYIDNNAGTLVNYGARYRKGLPISSSIAESAVNQVVSHRMAKKQQMRWTDEGAHCLAQVRVADSTPNSRCSDWPHWQRCRARTRRMRAKLHDSTSHGLVHSPSSETEVDHIRRAFPGHGRWLLCFVLRHSIGCAAGYNLRWLMRAIVRLGLGSLFLRLLRAALSPAPVKRASRPPARGVLLYA